MKNFSNKNVGMATKMINFNGAWREFSNSAIPNALSQIEVEIKWLECLTLAASMTFPYFYTKNVAIATMMTYYVSFKELSSGTSCNCQSQIEVEIEGLNVLHLNLAVTLAYNANVAMASIMTQFDGVFKELSIGTVPNF